MAELNNKNINLPKNLLLKLQGECCICLEGIQEVGHIYKCGHVVHKTCIINLCPLCRK